MANTTTSLPNVFQNLRNLRAPHWIALILVFWALPFYYNFNSVAMMLFGATALWSYYKNRLVCADKILLIPIAFYLLMAFSALWTVDSELTVPAISKELALIVFPVCFMLLPRPEQADRSRIMTAYGRGFALYAAYCFGRALIRYAGSGITDVFFYHELVSLDVNAIHASVFMVVAFFALYTRTTKIWLDYVGSALLFVMIFMLSSKNVTLIFILLILLYHWFYADFSRKMKLFATAAGLVIISGLMLTGFIRERFQEEIDTLFTDNTINTEYSDATGTVYNVSLSQAWSDPSFRADQYFSGTAFRVYQARVFYELMQRDKAWLLGYGLNASYPKIGEVSMAYGLYQGDGKTKSGYYQLNFHNQYLQVFAELGIIGLILLLSMLIISLKKALRHKDFVHISFTVLMISVFLTESFLWRQRGATFFIAMYCLLMLADRPTNKNRL